MEGTTAQQPPIHMLSTAEVGATAIAMVLLTLICALVCLVFVFLCPLLKCECCYTHTRTSNGQRRNRQSNTTRSRDLTTGTEPQVPITEDTMLQKVPPPSYSKAGLYTTDENYDKEHHTYIRPVDSDDVFDNRSEPPAYESRIRMSIGSRPSVVSSTHSSANDSDVDQPPRMRVPTEGELNAIEETNETERPSDPP